MQEIFKCDCGEPLITVYGIGTQDFGLLWQSCIVCGENYSQPYMEQSARN